VSTPPEVTAGPTAQLLDYLGGARWFAGKGRTPELVSRTPLPWLSEPGTWPAVRCEVAEVRYLGEGAQAGETELYQLALSYWPEPRPELAGAAVGRFADPELGNVVAYDAMQDRSACSLILQRLRERRESTADGATVRFHLQSDHALPDEDPEPRIHTGEQSNTSVMYGEVAMLKLFRRLELGRNLDIEVHEALTRSGVGDVARLYGWVEGSWPAAGKGPDQLGADLAMVVEKLADAQDGWRLALAALRAGQDFTDSSAALGRALAEIHVALRDEFGATSVAGGAVADVMSDRLLGAARIAPDLQEHLEGLQRCFRALDEVKLPTQRVHGDFHLGQALATPDGWKIIDFEGEPAKSLSERAAPDSVWRDVAGMLRSFDYAAASVPDPGSQAWAQRCRAAFLRGYVGDDLTPNDEAVLRAYLADKAVYEVVYEVRLRPEWVAIPLAAVRAIASAQMEARRVQRRQSNR